MIQYAGAGRVSGTCTVGRIRGFPGSPHLGCFMQPDKYRGTSGTAQSPLSQHEEEFTLLLLPVNCQFASFPDVKAFEFDRINLAMAATMKAVNYSGPFKVTVQDVEKPGIEHPDDVIVKVTTSGERNEKLHQWSCQISVF